MSKTKPRASSRAVLHALLLAFLPGALACADATGPSHGLAGTWDAFSAVVTNPADPAETADLVADGWSLRLVIEPTGAVEFAATFAGQTTHETGTFATDGTDVTLTLDGDPATGTYRLRGDTLTLDLLTGVEWDFEGDGLDEPASLRIVFRRS
ncbi:MAG: hypothetical protein PVH00_06275 [Gemmatimonadota bacterium]|jgi:hypothetical protein